MSKSERTRIESGAQLLARLSTRPCLKHIDPHIFGHPSSMTPQQQTTRAERRAAAVPKVVELYGGEGTGKSQLALHMVARTCLPAEVKGLSLDTLGAKVIFIDTDFKFSALTFAVVLERVILHEVSKQSKILKETKHSDSLTSVQNLGSVDDSHLDKRQKLAKKTNNAAEQVSENTENVSLTTEEVDQIVQDSMSRVQVLRVNSSAQLLVTLHSLDNTLLCDPRLSLVVIDSVSAFYWHDRNSDPDNIHCTEQKIKPIADVIGRLAKEFGMTFLVTKCALIGGKRQQGDEFLYQGRSGGGGDAKQNCEHVEFLGKSWTELQSKIIILTRKLNGKGQVEFTAGSSTWSDDRTFVINNDLLNFS